MSLYIAISECGFIADEHGGVDWLPHPEEESDSDSDEVGCNVLYRELNTYLWEAVAMRKSLALVAGYHRIK